MRALASHQCGPGSILPDAVCGWCLLLLLALLRGLLSGLTIFLPSTKTNISKFQFDQEKGPAWKPGWCGFLSESCCNLFTVIEWFVVIIKVLKNILFNSTVLTQKEKRRKQKNRKDIRENICLTLHLCSPRFNGVLYERTKERSVIGTARCNSRPAGKDVSPCWTISRASAGYQLGITILYPTSASGIIILLQTFHKYKKMKNNYACTYHICRAWFMAHNPWWLSQWKLLPVVFSDPVLIMLNILKTTER